MTLSTRELLASVLGELPAGEIPQAEPEAGPPRPKVPPPLPSPSPRAEPAADRPAGPWRVTARMHGGKVQISNNRESRVVPKEHVETYLRGHGPAVLPER